MGKESAKTKKEVSEITAIIPDDLPFIYSNFAGFFLSNTDCIIDFGVRDHRSNTAKIHTRIAMSPEQTKIFVDRLQGLLVEVAKKIK